jgi:hypothetical protein
MATAKKPAAKKKAPPKKAPLKKTAAKKAPAKKTPAKPAVHTVHHGGGWANKRAGSDRVSKVFKTKAEAQAAGRLTAMRDKVEHIIHKADGKIGERNSYGNDPRGRG